MLCPKNSGAKRALATLIASELFLLIPALKHAVPNSNRTQILTKICVFQADEVSIGNTHRLLETPAGYGHNRHIAVKVQTKS